MSSASKRMESDLNTMQMRAMLDTAGAAPASTGNTSGSGGISQEFPVTRFSSGYTADEKKDLTDKLNTLYQTPQFQALSQHERQSVLVGLAGNPPLTRKR